MWTPLPEADRQVDDFLWSVQTKNDIAQLNGVNDSFELTYILKTPDQILVGEYIPFLKCDPPP
jgi:hypothetical protein